MTGEFQPQAPLRDMSPGQARAALRRGAVDLIRRLVRARGIKADDCWRSPLREIEDIFAYNAWDLLTVAAQVSFYHHKHGLPAAVRSVATAQARRFRSALEDKNLRRWRDRWMSGSLPFASTIMIEENLPLPPDVRHPEGAWHRPAEWALNEFAGHCGVILGKARVDLMRDPPDDSDEAMSLAFDYGAALISGILGERIVRGKLRARYNALKRQTDLPPLPDDQDPLTWYETVWNRCRRHAGAEPTLRMMSSDKPGVPSKQPEPEFAKRRVWFTPGQAEPRIELIPVDTVAWARILSSVLPPRQR